MEQGWNGLPYYPISNRYKSLFGEKVYKVPVAVVDDCPNRMGLKGMKTCSFCDVWGSAARSEAFSFSLDEQLQKYTSHIRSRFKAKKFLVYFQAYTNSFAKISYLQKNLETAANFSDDIAGFVIGTRPDCLSPAIFDLWNSYHNRLFVSIELGVQSFFDDDLIFYRRGHSSKDSLLALEKIASHTKVDIGVHLIFGSPYENDDRIIQTAQICNSLPISNIKIHNLHVLKNTELEKLYSKGQFTPISKERYAYIVQLFLSHLRPDIAIHRLSAFSSRFDELVTPQWTSDKMGTHQYIIDTLRLNQTYQSKFYSPKNESEATLKDFLRHQSEASNIASNRS